MAWDSDCRQLDGLDGRAALFNGIGINAGGALKGSAELEAIGETADACAILEVDGSIGSDAGETIANAEVTADSFIMGCIAIAAVTLSRSSAFASVIRTETLPGELFVSESKRFSLSRVVVKGFPVAAISSLFR